MSMNDNKMNRRNLMEYIYSIAAALFLAGLAESCSNVKEKKPAAATAQTGGNCLANGITYSMTNDHGHILTVPIGDISIGTAKTYDITGNAGHSHDLTLAASDFSTLAGNHGVTVTSTPGLGHTHDVTINCL